MRILTLVLGLILGVLVLDETTVIDTLAGFAGTDEAALVALLGYVVTILAFVGAALAIPAPRGAAITFLVAGGIGAFLGATTIWGNMIVWSGAAFILALFAYIGHWRKRRKTRRKIEAAASAS